MSLFDAFMAEHGDTIRPLSQGGAEQLGRIYREARRLAAGSADRRLRDRLTELVCEVSPGIVGSFDAFRQRVRDESLVARQHMAVAPEEREVIAKLFVAAVTREGTR